MTDIAIKFPRPDGEARLEWIEVEAHSDGGYVRLRIGNEHWSYDGRNAFDGLGVGLVAYVGTVAAREILAEAERIRNANRRLVADGSEWRGEAAVYTFSAPDLLGCVVQTDGGPKALLSFASIKGSPLLEAVKPWHRRAYFPLLQPDECYPPNELPRKMADDEVRDGTGAAHTIRTERRSDGSPYRLVFGSWGWQPGDQYASSENNPENVDGQLARLQAFWERSQKPSEPARVTDVRFGLDRDVDFTFKGSAYFYYGEWCNKELHAELHPLDIALIERCWAEGRLGEQKDSGQRTGSGSGPDAATTPAPVSGTEKQDAVVTEAHSVTPSGEVKAPFGLEWRDDPGDSAVGIRDAVVLDVGPVFCFYTPPSKHVDITIGGVGTVEERLRAAHAALSGHIRRGEEEADRKASEFVKKLAELTRIGANASVAVTWHPEEPAPDLTELREAWENWAPGRSSLDGFNELLAAVERLVGK